MLDFTLPCWFQLPWLISRVTRKGNAESSSFVPFLKTEHWNFAFDSGHLVFNYSSAKNGTGSGSDSAVPQRVGSNGSLKGAATAAKGLCDLCVKHWAAGLTLMSGQMAGVLVCFVYCFKCMCTVCQQDCNEAISSLHFLVHPSVTGTSNIF